jgi:hypothetical protein
MSDDFTTPSPPPPPEGSAPPPAWPGPGEQAWPAQGQPQPWGTPYDPPKRRRFPVLLLRIGVPLLLIFGFGAARTFYRDNLKAKFTTPTQIGDAVLSSDPRAVATAKDLRKDNKQIHRSVSGFYTSQGQPAFILLAGDSNEDSAHGVYDSFKKDATDNGVTFDSLEDFGPVTCAKARSTDLGQIVVCFWGSGKSDGVMMHFGTSDTSEAADITKEARAAIEG